MLYSHKFPPINLHIFECLFCVNSVLCIEDLETFKALSLPLENSQICEKANIVQCLGRNKRGAGFYDNRWGQVPNRDLDDAMEQEGKRLYRGGTLSKYCRKSSSRRYRINGTSDRGEGSEARENVCVY